MLKYALLTATVCLAACNADGTPTAQTAAALAIGCAVDGVVQPIAAQLASTLVPAAGPVVGLDNALVHPAVVAACAKLGGKPVVVAKPSAG